MRDNLYIRIDKGENVVETILSVCEKEEIQGGHFQGIGACDTVTVSTYIAEKQEFVDHTCSGMIAGRLKEARIGYTGEIIFGKAEKCRSDG
ncbi:MAG: DUF296 domain-containing protein [Clostridiales bacterium]|nr:DUF296 domain-containing protein [Clostridiales bacterium]